MFSHQQEQYGKRSLLLILIIMLAVIVSSCGTKNADTAVSATAQAIPTASIAPTEATQTAIPEAAKTKIITTVNGDIEVPIHPQRIVAEEYLGTLIALNVIPVGAPALTLENYYFKDALIEVADTGIYGKPSAENILGLNPDLIITGNVESYAVLSKIAPTLVIPYGNLKNVQDELTYFGSLLDKQDEAKVWLDEFNRRITAAKVKVDAAIPTDASFTIMEDGEKTTWVYGNNFGRGGQPIYQSLDRKPPAGIAEEIMKKQWAEISAEKLGEYAGDYIIMTSNKRTLADFQAADPIWGNIPAVKNGHMYVWPESRSWYYDPLAVLAQTEELSDWLVSKSK